MTNLIEYPDQHPHAERIRSKKEEIDREYEAIETIRKEARVHYAVYMDSLKSMGSCHDMIDQKYKGLAKAIEELKEIITEPTI